MRIQTYDSRRHIRMGISELEASLLSGKAPVREIPRPLRQPVEHSRSELHVSPFSNGETASRLDRSDSCEFSIRHQGAPENHPRRKAARGSRFHFRFSALATAAG